MNEAYRRECRKRVSVVDVEVLIAGILSVLLGAGHETLGLVWVLPRLTKDRVEETPFGPPTMTLAMLRATWHIVTVFALGMGTLLIAIAAAPDADPQTLLLRWASAMWLGAAVAAVVVAIRLVRSMRRLFRLPVPVVFVAVSVLCWMASL